MSRQSEWIHRLDSVQNCLEALPEGAVLGRSHVQKLFQVSSRQANRILHRLGAQQAGGALLLGREELQQRLTALRTDPGVVFQTRRRIRLEQQLEEARRESRSRRIVIRQPSRLGPRFQLPAEIRLEPDRLEIKFSDPAELLERMLLLASAIAEDWEGFSGAMGAAVGAGKST
jgi:hypothetical protein